MLLFFLHIKLLLGSIPTFALSVPVLQVRAKVVALHVLPCLASLLSHFCPPMCIFLKVHLMRAVCLHLFV